MSDKEQVAASAELPVWRVTLGSLSHVLQARSHQAAKRASLDYWARCCGDPKSYAAALRARVAENWRGGLRAKIQKHFNPAWLRRGAA